MEMDEERKAKLEKMVATATTTERNIDQELLFAFTFLITYTL